MKEGNSFLIHIGEKRPDILARKKFIPIKGMPLLTCNDCLTSKQHRVTFHKFSPQRLNILDLIHIDVCTMDARTLDGTLYFVIFIYDHSRKVLAFTLKFKD